MRKLTIDLFIAIAAVAMVIWVAVRQFKAYKKKGSAAFCGGNCSRCDKNCEAKIG